MPRGTERGVGLDPDRPSRRPWGWTRGPRHDHIADAQEHVEASTVGGFECADLELRRAQISALLAIAVELRGLARATAGAAGPDPSDIEV